MTSPIRTLLCSAIAVGLALSAASVASAQVKLVRGDAVAWDAARVLYGEGLTIKRGKTVAVSPKKKKGLTQAKWNTYVTKYFIPGANQTTIRRKGQWFRWSKDYADAKYDVRAATKVAALMHEPYFKLQICRILAGISIKDVMKAFPRMDWCTVQALIEASHNVHLYRGTAATFEDAAPMVKPDLNATIWAAGADGNVPIYITVAGKRVEIDHYTLRVMNGFKKIDDSTSPKEYKAAQAIRRKIVPMSHKLEKSVAKKTRKLVGKKKVGFALKWFNNMRVPTLVKKGETPACKDLNYLAYTPKGSGKFGNFIVVKANKLTFCEVAHVDSNDTYKSALNQSNECRAIYLKGGGPMTIEVAVHAGAHGGSGKHLKIRKGKLAIGSHAMAERGKKLYSATVTCK